MNVIHYAMKRATDYFRDRRTPKVEAHINRNELAAIIGAAFMAGAEWRENNPSEPLETD